MSRVIPILLFVLGAFAILLFADYVSGENLLVGSISDALGIQPSDDDDDDDNDGSDSGSSSTSSSPASAILSALAKFENVASQHNNPGAICGSFDSNGNCLGPATYPDLATGVAKAEALIQKYLITDPEITVAAFVKKWSGASGDVLSNYTNSVANDLGLDPNDPISDAGGDDD